MYHVNNNNFYFVGIAMKIIENSCKIELTKEWSAFLCFKFKYSGFQTPKTNSKLIP